jgi:hypothetical protein
VSVVLDDALRRWAVARAWFGHVSRVIDTPGVRSFSNGIAV